MEEQHLYAMGAAFAGATWAAYRRPIKRWQHRAAILFGGWGFFYFCGPAVIEFFKISSAANLIAFSFLCGCVGHEVLEVCCRYARENIITQVLSLLKGHKE